MNALAEKYNKYDIEKKNVLKIILIAVISRLLIFVFGYVAAYAFGVTDKGFFSSFTDIWNAADSEHYYKIAEFGYASSGDNAKYIVFYPLYPLLIKLFAMIFKDYAFSAIFVSNVCFVISCVYLYKLTRIDYNSETSKDSVWMMIIFPFSMFLSCAMTESLFIMLSLMCIYYARKEKWFRVGLLGFFAAFSRTQGIILLIPAAYEYLLAMCKKKRADKSSNIFKYLKANVICLLFIPLGYGLYLVINKLLFDDFFMFREFMRSPPWWNDMAAFWQNLAQHYEMGVQYYQLGLVLYFAQLILFFLLCGLLIYAVIKKVRTSYIIYSFSYLVASYMASWLLSGGRYMLGNPLFFIPMALLVQNRVSKNIIYAFSGLLMSFYLILFLRGFAIM